MSTVGCFAMLCGLIKLGKKLTFQSPFLVSHNCPCSVSCTDQLAQILVYLHFDLVISFLILELNSSEMVLEMLTELIILMTSIGLFLHYYIT